MKKVKAIAVPALLLILLVAGSYTAKTDPESDQSAGYYLTGVIGKNIAVQMSLVKAGDDNAWKGSAYYESQGVAIDLDASMSGDTARVKEVIPKETGGIYTGKINTSDNTYTGTWTSGDNKKSLPFKLNIVAVYRRTGPDTIVPRFTSTQEAYGKLNAAIEAKLSSQVANEKTPAHGVCEITYYTPGLVSIACTPSEKSGPSSPPAAGPEQINYFLDDTGFHSFSLKDVFGEDSMYQDDFSSDCRQELKSQGADLAGLDSDEKMAEYIETHFTFNSRFFTFYFSLRDAASGAWRNYEVKKELVSFGARPRAHGPLAPIIARSAKTTTRLAGYYLTGVIGKSIRIQMDLSIDVGNNQSSGIMYYESQGRYLDLAAKRDGNKLRLLEKNKSQTTGLYDGTIDKDHNTYTGTWSSADQTRSLPFKLDIAAVSRQRTLTDMLHSECTTTFLEFTSDRQAFKALGKDPGGPACDEDVEGTSSGLSLRYYSPTLLSMESSGYYQPVGAAHGSIYSAGHNYVLKGDRFVPFKMKDIFKPGSGYQAAVAALCRKDLERQDENGDFQLGSDQDLAKNMEDKFLFNTKYIFIEFDPYAIASWADGPQEAKIEIDKVRSLIDPEGPFKTLLSPASP